jgi:hypothetical protein
MPTVITEGAASARSFGFGASGAGANYIEDVFSNYLYTGNGTSQTILNGINLYGSGGLVWMKSRSAATDHAIYDTARGATFDFVSNSTAAQTTQATGLTSFGSTGFSIGSLAKINTNAETYVSWTFRKRTKFFDIVTYAGTGVARTISHNLGSTPGCIIVKRTDTTSDWQVYHSGLTSAAYSIQLNLTSAQASATTVWNSTSPTSSVFSVGTSASVNASGGTYVAYIYASNAGGFGAAGTDNVITCGTFATDSTASASVTLGYEPQWIMLKRTNGVSDWILLDVMRGQPVTLSNTLSANSGDFEQTGVSPMPPNATGFTINAALNTSSNYIYIAIRRGPMKTPTDATKVFGVNARTGTSANATVTGGQTDDAVLIKNRASVVASLLSSRLTGTGYLVTSSQNTEAAAGLGILQDNPWDVMDGVKVGISSTITNASGNTFVNYLFRRAPGFFDEVCYTGNAIVNTARNHNLGVVPELMIFKSRSIAASWPVYSKYLNNSTSQNEWKLLLNSTSAQSFSAQTFGTQLPDATYFYTSGNQQDINFNGITYLVYLFASCPGVSKVGSYSGTGATQTINCGFTAGARFVLIKRINSTGDWYVFDTARGMVSGTDPYLLLNSTDAEVNANSVYTVTTGFQIVSTAAGINASGSTYIFLAIA